MSSPWLSRAPLASLVVLLAALLVDSSSAAVDASASQANHKSQPSLKSTASAAQSSHPPAPAAPQHSQQPPPHAESFTAPVKRAGHSLWSRVQRAVSPITLLPLLLRVAGPLLMLLYPLIESLQAIERPDRRSNQQWLPYWVLYSLVSLLELLLAPLLHWVPLYPALKVLGFAWLVLPEFRGASLLYARFMRRFALALLSRRAHLAAAAERRAAERAGRGPSASPRGVQPASPGKDEAGEEGGPLSAEQQCVLEGLSGPARDLLVEFVKDNGAAALTQTLAQALQQRRRVVAPAGAREPALLADKGSEPAAASAAVTPAAESPHSSAGEGEGEGRAGDSAARPHGTASSPLQQAAPGEGAALLAGGKVWQEGSREPRDDAGTRAGRPDLRA